MRVHRLFAVLLQRGAVQHRLGARLHREALTGIANVEALPVDRTYRYGEAVRENAAPLRDVVSNRPAVDGCNGVEDRPDLAAEGIEVRDDQAALDNALEECCIAVDKVQEGRFVVAAGPVSLERSERILFHPGASSGLPRSRYR